MKSLTRFSMIMGLVLALGLSTRGESLPHPRIQLMCGMVDLIVEGTWQEGDRVAVTRVWRGPPDVPQDIKQLTVSGIGGLPRISDPYRPFCRRGDKDINKPIATKNVTLFLKRDEKKQTWSPLYTMAGGSRGVIWWDETTCHSYGQVMNPGDYYLTPATAELIAIQKATPVGPREMRKAIEEGLAARSQYESVLAIVDPAQRAAALVRYVAPRKTPASDAEWFYLYKAAEALGELKTDAVPALVAALKAASADDKIYHLLAPLQKMGRDAVGASDQVVKVLDRQDKDPGTVCSAIRILANLGDLTYAPHIRPFLNSTDSSKRRIARYAVQELKDRGAFESLAQSFAQSFPAKITTRNADEVMQVILLMQMLDHISTRHYAAKLATEPALSQSRERLEAMQKP